MAGVLKKTTGLTGLLVAPTPHHTLGGLYSKILRTLQKMPDTAPYRQHTEKLVLERAAILKSNQSIYEVERQIGCGQVEELIVQAENELTLARKMMAWKAWEPLIGTAPKGQWQWPPA